MRGNVENLNGLTQQSFSGSALFERTFDEGMALVEETARYLDGKGREESRGLPRKTAMLYAGESMRVTTRLMQAASWLLVQRAVHEGEMEADAAGSDRYRLGSKEICLGAADGWKCCRPCCATFCTAATIFIAALRGWMMSCSAAPVRRAPACMRISTAWNRRSARVKKAGFDARSGGIGHAILRPVNRAIAYRALFNSS